MRVIIGVKDLWNYFKQKQSISKSTLVASGTDVSEAELVIVEKETEALKPRKQYNKDIPEVSKMEVGRYAPIHGIKAASDFFNKKYP